MKKQLPLVLLLGFYLLLSHAAKAIPVNVQKTPGSNEITADLVIPSGRSINATGTGQIAASSLVVTYPGQTSITILGTILTGTWNGSVIAGQYGGTGVNNSGKTITLGGNLITSGAFAATLTFTGTTNVTFPTSGTLVGSADTGTVTNGMLAGSIANAKLANSSVTIGSTTVALGGTAGTLAGLTLTAPTISGTTSLTGTVTVSGQLIGKGTATNDSAATGYIGEFITATIASGSAVSLTTATTANVTSISLTAGDWDVSGVVDYTANVATVIQSMKQGTSATTATLGAQDTFSTLVLGASVTTDPANVAPTVRISLASTTTIYLVANASFTISTLSAYGTISARRQR